MEPALRIDEPGGSPAGDAAVLIYDGECPACRRAVEWVERNARPGSFGYLSCHSSDLAGRFPSIDKGACLTAMHLVLPGGTVLAGAKAAPEILSRLPRFRRLAGLFRLPGVAAVSRLLYSRFARHRHPISRILFPGG